MKTTFVKRCPKEVLYGDYKHFNNCFKEDLKKQLGSYAENMNIYSQFEKKILGVLDRHAPMKKKTVRANEVPYMTKPPRKASNKIKARK